METKQMNMRRLLSIISRVALLSALGMHADGQMTDQAARQKAQDIVRSQLDLRSEQFLGIRRDEELEQDLAAIVGGLAGSEFIYRVSQAGDEIKDHAVVHHLFMDIDPTYHVAVNRVDGSVYRIQGFRDSKAEFNKLMSAVKVKISSLDQAEALADFFRTVNPEHYSMTRISGLLDLKQAAERQCQAVPFDPNEKDFEAWWKHTKPPYEKVRFDQTAAHSGSGYVVEWIVLSAEGPGLCGGAPLRAVLEVERDGEIGKLTFIPLRSKGPIGTTAMNRQIPFQYLRL
jgi:hypothetical protein